MDYKVATRWIEFTEYQAKGISKILVNPPKIKRLYHLALIWYLFVPKLNFHHAYRFYILIKNVPLRVLKKYLHFIYQNPQSFRFPKYVKLKGRRYYGPGEFMKNVKMKEFKVADEYFYLWKQTNNPQYLDAFCLVLYRLPSTGNLADKREDFTDQGLINRGPLAKYLPEDFKMAVALSFLSCKIAWMKKYQHVFPTSENTTQEDAKPKPTKYQHYDKVIMAMAMSEFKVLGNIHDIEDTYVEKFFSVLNEDIRIDKEKAIKQVMKK